MLGLGFLSLAGFILPRSWQERSQSRVAGPGEGRWQQLRFGNRGSAPLYADASSERILVWLTARDRQAPIQLRLAFPALPLRLPAVGLFGLAAGNGRFDLL